MIKRQAGTELPGGRVDGEVAMRIPRGDGIKDVISMTCGQGNGDRKKDLCSWLPLSDTLRTAAASVADTARVAHSSTVYMCF